MKPCFDTMKLGGALLGLGPVLINLVNARAAYWTGLIFCIAGPLLIAFAPTKKPAMPEHTLQL